MEVCNGITKGGGGGMSHVTWVDKGGCGLSCEVNEGSI